MDVIGQVTRPVVQFQHGRPIRSHYFLSCMVGFRTQSLHIITPPGILYAHVSCDLTVLCNGLPRSSLSYSGDALRSFNVQPTSKLCRNVRKRLFSLRIWSPRYKHVNSDVNSQARHLY